MFTSVGEKQLGREFYCSLFDLSESELAVVKFLQGLVVQKKGWLE